MSATQIVADAALGIADQAFLTVVIGYFISVFGFELLDMARNVAAFNLPGRVGQLFGVSLWEQAPLRSTLREGHFVDRPAHSFALLGNQ